MISLTINETKHNLNADPQMPLLWAIRDELTLTGTKYGCGKGLCGACTVHLNGRAVRSCITPLEQASNSTITTIEGIAQGAAQNREPERQVEETWLEQSVPQCGYCQPGQIMSAVALLKQNPTPTDAQINNAMSGNICRCGTYPRIKTAIVESSKQLAKSVS